jgi:hypothetical protein
MDNNVKNNDIEQVELEKETGVSIDMLAKKIVEYKETMAAKKQALKKKKEMLIEKGTLPDEARAMFKDELQKAATEAAGDILGELKFSPDEELYISDGDDHNVILHNAVIDTAGSDTSVVIASLYVDGYIEQRYGILNKTIPKESYPNPTWWLMMHYKDFTFYNYMKDIVKPQAKQKLAEVTKAWNLYKGKVLPTSDLTEFDVKDVKSIIGRFKIGELNGAEDIYLFKDYIEFALSAIDTYLKASPKRRQALWRSGMIKYKEKNPDITAKLEKQLIGIRAAEQEYSFNSEEEN